METTLRNASAQRMFELLLAQRARRMDLVVPASKLSSRRGQLLVEAPEFAELTEDGVTPGFRVYDPNTVAIEGLADKLGIPTAYLRRMHVDRPDLFDANVNGWLAGGHLEEVGGLDLPNSAGPGSSYTWPADARSFTLRTFTSDEEGGVGLARAVLSDKFKAYDNLDVLTVALEQVGLADPEAQMIASDLSERRMYVKVLSPRISVPAPNLLANYRSPFDGPGGVRRAGEMVNMRSSFEALRQQFGDNHFFKEGEARVHGGIAIGNSEVGNGALTLSPFIFLPICSNGSTLIQYVMRKTHLGARLDEGVIEWSEGTQTLNLELVGSQVRDAVAKFMSTGFLEEAVRTIDEQAGVVLASPMETVTNVTKKLGVSEDRLKSVMDHFVRGGQSTAGGLFNAITSVAQTIPDADDAAAFEALGLRALEMAAAN